MSQQGPILVVSTSGRPSFASTLDEAKLFPVIDTVWADAARAVEQLRPGAVLAAMAGAGQPAFDALARQIAASEPYLPLIAVDPTGELPENAIPFAQGNAGTDRLLARLNAALRVRSLHATVMRRLDPAKRTGVRRDRYRPRRDRAADRPRQRLSGAVGGAWRAHGRGRCAEHRGRRKTPQHPRYRRHRAWRRFFAARGPCIPDGAHGGCTGFAICPWW